ncbi:HNH endonuclease signature motif containing protein [Micromonospora sp. NPDC005652]|uniref:HNH endonuclease signature motif containing protein n=1 Tax=Micromonospora sp. NPDC005652 TaxID=3157046 RepID=UPI0034096977
MTTLKERFFARVALPDADGCMLWLGTETRGGYGQIRATGGRRTLVHRLSYEMFVGPIPDGLQIDHRCHNEDKSCLGGRNCRHRRCVNPSHLEPVTNRVNTLRGVGVTAQHARATHCTKSHPLSGDNLRIRPDTGARVCRQCVRDAGARYRSRTTRCRRTANPATTITTAKESDR